MTKTQERFDRNTQRILLDLEDLRGDCLMLNDQEIVDKAINALKYAHIEGRA